MFTQEFTPDTPCTEQEPVATANQSTRFQCRTECEPYVTQFIVMTSCHVTKSWVLWTNHVSEQMFSRLTLTLVTKILTFFVILLVDFVTLNFVLYHGCEEGQNKFEQQGAGCHFVASCASSIFHHLMQIMFFSCVLLCEGLFTPCAQGKFSPKQLCCVVTQGLTRR